MNTTNSTNSKIMYIETPECATKIYQDNLCTNYACKFSKCAQICVNGSFCSVHSCTITGCIFPKREDNNYCFSHECRRNGCKKLNQKGHYCIDHCCSNLNCNKRRIQRGIFCSKHYCCHRECVKVREKGDYCSDHCCQVQDCCKSIVKNSTYCDEHCCIGEFTHAPYGSHRCSALRCENSRCCLEHKCQICGERKFTKLDFGIETLYFTHPYCSDHCCHYFNKNETCQKLNIGENKFCPDHKCLLCDNQKVKKSEYCEWHCCCYDTCTKKQIGYSHLCATHMHDFWHKADTTLKIGVINQLCAAGEETNEIKINEAETDESETDEIDDHNNKCRYFNGKKCFNKVYMNDYCEDHLCITPGCGCDIIGNTRFCLRCYPSSIIHVKIMIVMVMNKLLRSVHPETIQKIYCLCLHY